MQLSLQLLIAALQAGFQPNAQQRLISMISQATENDWQNFLELSDHHNVSNLLRSSLHKNEAWGLLPDTVRQTLDARYHNTVAWSLKLSHSLEKVIPAFEKAGIPIIPWKGPALSQRLFDNIWTREYTDLDFLIPPQYQARTTELLQAMGYSKEGTDTHEPPANLANNNDHCQSWVHQSSQTLLEVHWKPFPSAFRFTPSIEDLLSRCALASFRSVSPSQLSLEDELILLVGHGAKHHWSQLNWLCDFAHFVQRYGKSLNWKQINITASETGFIRIIKTALCLVENLFQITLAPNSFDQPATDYTACRLAATYATQLRKYAPISSQRGSMWKYHWLIKSMLARERYRDRLPVILSAIAYTLTPNNSDRELCSSSFPLSLVAWLVRPLRLIRKYALHPFK